MSLGPQCRACRQRRVRCDSAYPACAKCSRKGIECPGYSSSRALRWRHYVSNDTPQPEESMPKLPRALELDGLCMRADDVAPWGVISYNLDYYNTRIVPDLAACDMGGYKISPAAWLTFGLAERHLRLCVVSLHKAVQQIADDQWDSDATQTLRKHASQEMVFFHHHQACAARILQNQVDQLRDHEPDFSLVAGAAMFLSSQIQESAYGAWHVHLSGANIMLDRRMRSITSEPGLVHERFFCFQLMMMDVYRTTTSSKRFLSASMIAQHRVYLERMSHLNFDSRVSLTPVPDDIVRATIAINLLRADREASPAARHLVEQEESISPAAALLASLQAYKPGSWSVADSTTDIPKAQDDLGGWRLLARCFQAAAILYLILSETMPPLDSYEWNLARDRAYSVLLTSIRQLFDQKTSGGKHHKFILWPIVVAGVEVTARGDRVMLEFLICKLKTLTTDLGTMAMREAACFLEGLWDDCVRNRPDLASYVRIDWDHVFESGPIFLL